MDEMLPFGVVLSRYRIAVGLTQEELAERAGLSPQAISALERGIRSRPRAYTVRQLIEALGLTERDREIFEQAAREAAITSDAEPVMSAGDFLGALPTTELVARVEEQVRLRSIVDAVADGTGHVVFLGGESGAGKTRLLQELTQEVDARGFVVVLGRCYPAEQETSYYLFLGALAGLAPRLAASVRQEGQRTWKRVQALAGRGAAGNGAGTGPAVEQQLFEEVSHLLLLGAHSTPLAVLLDDLHWADDQSLKLLQHVAHTSSHAPVLLAGSFRDVQVSEEHPELAHTLQILNRERLAERITVRRLSLEETTALVEVTMDQEEVSEEFAHFVYRRTKGIPRLIDQLVRSLGGRLELREEIGSGAMGRVFRAFDRTLQRTVAAKLVLARHEIDLDTLLRFQQEGAVLAQLDHPHIVRIYDSFAEEHASCIIMELLEGQSLGTILRNGPLPLHRAKQIALQVADALSYAHAQQIIHRDIKPDNVMVVEGDQVKVTDFGIARILQPDTSLGTIATTGMRMGTPLYMAPEQIEGKKVDGRTDVYGLGAMLYHMVTGRPPFEGSDALAVAVKQLQEQPVPPSQVNPAIPADWDALILKALAKEPNRRVQSTREMEHAIRELSERVSDTSPAGRRMPSLLSVRSVLVGLLALSVAVASALALVLRSTPVRAPIIAAPVHAIRATLTSPDLGGFAHLGGLTHFAVTPQALWVTNPGSGMLVRFSTTTNHEVAVVRVGDPLRDPGKTDPEDAVSGDGQLWATDRANRAIVRIDPRTNKLVSIVHLGVLTTSLVITGHTLWAAADPISPPLQVDEVIQVDLRTHRIVGVLHAGNPLGLQIAADGTAVWVLTPGGTHELERIDPTTMKVAAGVDTVPQPESLAVGDGAVWVLNQQGTLLARIDPQTNRVAATIDLSGYPGHKGGCACHNVLIADKAVWTLARNRTLVRIDPRSNRITAALTFKRDVADLVWGAGSIWVGTDGDVNHLGPYPVDRIDAQALM